MEIISWNVNGIRSCLKKGFEDWVDEKAPDVLCLQETRALEEQVKEDVWNPKGYSSYWYPAEKKGYSGVSVWTKAKPVAVSYGLGIEEFDREGRILILEFEDWVLYNGYFPNGGASEERLDYKMRFYDAFLKHSNEWKGKGKTVVTCGDFNTCHKEIDIARPKANAKKSGFLPKERKWMDDYVEQGYLDTFRVFNPDKVDCYSWWSNRGGARERNVGWRIDYFFIDEKSKYRLKNAFILSDVLGSDHCPVGIEFA